MSNVLDSFKRLLRISEDETKLTDAESKRLARYQVLEEINQCVLAPPRLTCRRAVAEPPTDYALGGGRSGAYSKVFRGVDKLSGLEVALKKTSKDVMNTRQVRPQRPSTPSLARTCSLYGPGLCSLPRGPAREPAAGGGHSQATAPPQHCAVY
jgi:hypothetical protein